MDLGARRGSARALEVVAVALLVALALIAAAAAGCGSGGGGGGGGAFVPVAGGAGGTAPGATAGFQTAAVSPADQAVGVSTAAAVILTFTAELDAATVGPATFFVVGPQGFVAGTYAVGAAATNQAVFTPSQPLALAARYDVQATTGIRDRQGRPLAASFQSRFETSGQPAAAFMAGVAAVDYTPPVGVPLGGFSEGPRRQSPPNFNPFDYDHLLKPSKGVLDPVYAKALVLSDGQDRVCIMALDAIAVTDKIVRSSHAKAAAQGFTVPLENCLVCASHTHSGPGTLTDLVFWQVFAMDLYQRQVFDDVTTKVARAMVEAERGMVRARFGSASGNLRGISKNRRVGDSYVFTRDDIDPEVGVLKFEKANGDPLATVYNFAVHGLGYFWDNLFYSSDIMGDASRRIEARTGGIALYANGAEGDVTPEDHGTTADVQRQGGLLADEVLRVLGTIQTTDLVDLATTSETLDLGRGHIDADPGRLGRRSGIGSNPLLAFLQQYHISPGVSFPMGPDWIENKFRFQAVRLNRVGIASLPGEGIHTLGLQIKQDGARLGFDKTYVFGLANGHMAYVTTEDEYWAGGYEALATMWGPKTGETVRNEAARLLNVVKP